MPAATERAAPAALLVAIAAVGWWWTTGRMQGMVNGPWTSLGTAAFCYGTAGVLVVLALFILIAPAMLPGLTIRSMMRS